MKYVALIPAYCPDDVLISTVQSLQEKEVTCIVVNDGSPKDYDPVFEKVSADAIILNDLNNRGKGYALKKGLKYIQTNMDPCVVITCDADGQHEVKDVIRAANMAQRHPDSIVIGMRDFNSKDVPDCSRMGNEITEKIFALCTGIHIHDTQTGLRAFHSDLLPMMLKAQGDRYEYEMNVLLDAVTIGIPILEIEIATVYENGNENSHFHKVRDSIRIYSQLLKFAGSSIACAAVNLGVFTGLAAVFPGTMGLLSADAAACAASGTLTYRFGKKLSNDTVPISSKNQYVQSSIIIFVTDIAVLYILTNYFYLSALYAKAITIILLFGALWGAERALIFKKRGAY